MPFNGRVYSIHYRASAAEWQELLDWVSQRTGEMLERNSENPWWLPKESEKDFQARLDQMEAGGTAPPGYVHRNQF